MSNILNQELKNKIIARASDPNFVHHKWFVKYHLDIVEKIAFELCDMYPNANKDIVETLVWLHDYEKIIDFDNQYNTELVATSELMRQVGFSEDAIISMTEQINSYNAKQNLQTAPIETQIVSSADAASHLVGPFVTLYWYENPHKTIDELQIENRRKFDKDWNKKVTLPEVKEKFQTRRAQVLEITGELPEKYF